MTEAEARADALALVGRRRGIRRITIGVGLALVLGGIALSTTALLHTLLPDGRDLSSTLALGARLFTYMLMVLGAYIAAAAWWLPPRVASAERGRLSERPFVAVILVGTIGLSRRPCERIRWTRTLVRRDPDARPGVVEIVRRDLHHVRFEESALSLYAARPPGSGLIRG